MLKRLLFTCILLASANLYAQDLVKGEVSSRDLLTNDIKKAEKFYTGLFSWTSVHHGKYIELFKDQKSIANIVHIDSKKHSHWMPQFSHNNLQDAKKMILKNGGTILKEVTNSDDGYKYLLIKDSQDALCVVSDDKENIFSEFPKNHEWLWDELWSFDTSISKVFYQKLFDYEVTKTATGYLVFMKNDKWVSGLLSNPFEGSKTQWVSTIKVEDPQVTSQKAITLGGKIIVSVDEHKGHREAALIADPTGAIFIVEKYTKEQK